MSKFVPSTTRGKSLLGALIAILTGFVTTKIVRRVRASGNDSAKRAKEQQAQAAGRAQKAPAGKTVYASANSAPPATPDHHPGSGHGRPTPESPSDDKLASSDGHPPNYGGTGTP
jgi:hypothetical protein